MITYDKQLFSSLSYWTGFAASFRTSAMFAVVISQLRYHAQVLHALWHDRRPTEFQHNDIMVKTPVQNDWDLRWHLGQCGLSVLMKVKLRTTENKRACASNCALTSTSHWLHKSGSTGLFHTSSCRKHFEFLKVNVQVTVALDQGISRLCDLFHNLWDGNINMRRMPASRFIRRIPTSRFIRRIPASRFTRHIPASRFTRQLVHLLCMLLFSSSANRCQHRLADTTHQTCVLYTQVRQKYGFSLRWNGWFSCLLQNVIKQSDSPRLLQSSCCVCVNSLIHLACSSCACSRDNVSVWVIWYSVRSRSTKFKKNRKIPNSSEFSPYVNSLDIDKNSCWKLD